jgi:hypothetical protein
MSAIEDGIPAEGVVVIEHLAEAWKLLLPLPGEEKETVTAYLLGHYDWCEIGAEAVPRCPQGPPR